MQIAGKQIAMTAVDIITLITLAIGALIIGLSPNPESKNESPYEYEVIKSKKVNWRTIGSVLFAIGCILQIVQKFWK